VATPQRLPHLIPATATSSTRSIGRALDILEVLAATPVPESLSRLARRTGFSKSTVHRILGALVDRGFVARAGRDYTPGPSAFLLTGTAAHPDRIQAILTPFLLELYESTRAAVSVGVLSNGRVLCSHGLYGRTDLAARQPSVSLRSTAIGKLLLAYTPSEADRIEPPDATLRCELATIRRRGIACGGNGPDEIEMAAPVFTAGERIVAGLRIVGPRRTLDPAAVSRQIVVSARASSAHLSGHYDC
jgi:DNA-binding IclR family transcriptional regulator